MDGVAGVKGGGSCGDWHLNPLDHLLPTYLHCW